MFCSTTAYKAVFSMVNYLLDSVMPRSAEEDTNSTVDAAGSALAGTELDLLEIVTPKSTEEEV